MPDHGAPSTQNRRRLSDLDIGKLHKAALALKRGGVGYYGKSRFVHLNTGRVRSW